MTALMEEQNSKGKTIGKAILVLVIIAGIGIGGFFLLINRQDDTLPINADDPTTIVSVNDNTNSINTTNSISNSNNNAENDAPKTKTIEIPSDTEPEPTPEPTTNTEDIKTTQMDINAEGLTNTLSEPDPEWRKYDLPFYSISFEYPGTYWRNDEQSFDKVRPAVHSSVIYSSKDCYTARVSTGVPLNDCLQIFFSIFERDNYVLPTEIKFTNFDTYSLHFSDTQYPSRYGGVSFINNYMDEIFPDNDRVFSVHLLYNEFPIINPVDDISYTYEFIIHNGIGEDMQDALAMNGQAKVLREKINETLSLPEPE